MKKLIALLLTLGMVACMFACTAKVEENTVAEPVAAEPVAEATAEPVAEAPAAEPVAEEVQTPEVTGMTYDEFVAAPLDSEVTVVTYVQAHQSWWDNKITVYTQNLDGGYFLYEMPCTEEEAAKLVPGTMIKVTGYKSEWAGEVEITDAKFELLGGDPYIAEATDVTALLGTDEMAANANKLVSFSDMVIESVSFKNDQPGDDIYVSASKDGVVYDFCLEYYLNGSDADFYSKVSALKAGDIVDIRGYLYYYYSIDPHMTAVEVKGNVNDKADGVMTYADYAAANIDDAVTVEVYVQAHQSWWDNKITVYAADADGAYFFYEMACSEEDAAKLVPGTKIKATGYKGEWSGEVEILDATFEIEEGSYIAPAKDATALLASEDLISLQNQLVKFTDMTVKSVSYKNDQPGDDIYVTFTKDGADYEFCVEYYLNGSDEAFYGQFANLAEGTVCDVEGFLYWYNGANTHITKITVK